MVKLRNYCTHYSVPLPQLGTTIRWEDGGPVLHINTLQLDRNLLLRWDKWGAVAKAYLTGQDEKFDLGPIIESYMSSVREFYEWFWGEIDKRSSYLKEELHQKARELQLWYDENNPRPDWLTSGCEPPPDWNRKASRVMRQMRARKRIERFAYGTRGFAVSNVNANGEIVFVRDEWSPLPG